MNICMYMYMNHVDVNLQMYEKIDIIFLIFQEKTRIMRKYEVIFYVRTQHVIFLKSLILSMFQRIPNKNNSLVY